MVIVVYNANFPCAISVATNTLVEATSTVVTTVVTIAKAANTTAAASAVIRPDKRLPFGIEKCDGPMD